jgi:hypothetical protein
MAEIWDWPGPEKATSRAEVERNEARPPMCEERALRQRAGSSSLCEHKTIKIEVRQGLGCVDKRIFLPLKLIYMLMHYKTYD